MKSYWLTCGFCTVEVETTDSDVITKAPAIVRKFVGQSLDALKRWMKKYGGFDCKPLAEQPGLF